MKVPFKGKLRQWKRRVSKRPHKLSHRKHD